MFSEVTAPFYISTTVYEGSSSFTFLPTLDFIFLSYRIENIVVKNNNKKVEKSVNNIWKIKEP